MQTPPAKKPGRELPTVERLLDTAERLFGEHGFDGVGMRALAQEAGVNLGAATYHFGSKERLYTATFLRRFRAMDAERQRQLQSARAAAKGRPIPVIKIVDCMLRPLFMIGLEHPCFHTLALRNLFFPPPFIHAALHKELESNHEIFLQELCRSLKPLSQDDIRLREMFCMGTLLAFSMHMNKLHKARNPTLIETILKELIQFATLGLQGQPITGPAVCALPPDLLKPPQP